MPYRDKDKLNEYRRKLYQKKKGILNGIPNFSYTNRIPATNPIIETLRAKIKEIETPVISVTPVTDTFKDDVTVEPVYE